MTTRTNSCGAAGENINLYHGVLREALKGLPDVSYAEDQSKLPDLQMLADHSNQPRGPLLYRRQELTKPPSPPPKCDETKPTCNQCAKTRRTCPGYKDDFDLVFRNETKATERKVQKAAGRKGSVSTISTSRTSIVLSHKSSVDSLSSSSDGSYSSISKLLSIPAEQLASCHFFSNFILVPRQGCTRGYMDYLLPLVRDEPSNGHLQHAFNACSLAHLGNRVKSDGVDIPNKALSEYTKALTATHKALMDPVKSKTDGTLAAVLLLGLYEVSTAHAPPDEALILNVLSRTSPPRRWASSPGALTWKAPSR